MFRVGNGLAVRKHIQESFRIKHYLEIESLVSCRSYEKGAEPKIGWSLYCPSETALGEHNLKIDKEKFRMKAIPSVVVMTALGLTVLMQPQARASGNVYSNENFTIAGFSITSPLTLNYAVDTRRYSDTSDYFLFPAKNLAHATTKPPSSTPCA